MTFKNGISLLALLMLLASCSSSTEKDTPKTDVGSKENKTVMHSVEITQMKFYPAELKVKKGDKVVFVNHDLVTHDITEESTKAWSSSPLATGQTWIFEATESVNYFCSIHPVMKGKIIVD